MNSERFVITISHQFGSGGSAVGQKLSKHFSVPFIDRDILKNVAAKLHLEEADIQGRDERLSTFWEMLSRTVLVSDPLVTATFKSYMVTDRELFQLESEYIERITNETSAVILGRCARHILRFHSRRISILVHARLPDRIKRVGEMFQIGAAEAETFIENNDRERAAYIHNFTKQDWTDARLYDLCINTSVLGLDPSAELVNTFVETKMKAVPAPIA